uniref:MBD domain-containing protein n=1 Tax=Macrostomum lignano TaxID=282301 RepID=A0A1I8F5I1_9PLAT
TGLRGTRRQRKESRRGRGKSKKHQSSRRLITPKHRSSNALFKKYASDKGARTVSMRSASLQGDIGFSRTSPPGVSDKAKKKRDGNALYLYKTYLGGCSSVSRWTRTAEDANLKGSVESLHSKLNLLFPTSGSYNPRKWAIDMSALKNMSRRSCECERISTLAARRGKKAPVVPPAAGRRDKNSNDDDFIAAFDLAAVLPRGGGGGGVRRRAYDLTDLSKYIKHRYPTCCAISSRAPFVWVAALPPSAMQRHRKGNIENVYREFVGKK